MTQEMSLTVKAEIRNKLNAQAALNYLYYSNNDERGLALAASLEDEAHTLWRAQGRQDVPTYVLVNKVAE